MAKKTKPEELLDLAEDVVLTAEEMHGLRPNEKLIVLNGRTLIEVSNPDGTKCHKGNLEELVVL